MSEMSSVHQPATGAETVSLRDLAMVAAARFPFMLAVAAAVFVLGSLYVLTRSPVYRAETTIIVEPQISGLLASEAASRGRAETEMMMRNQVEILRSRPVLQRVAEELELVSDPSDMDSMISRLQNRTRIRYQEGSGIITIIARSREPELSAALANEVAAAYLAVQSEYRNELDVAVSASLTERVAELAQQVRIAEEAVTAFRAENDLTDVSENQSLTGVQLADANRELAQARSDFSAAKAKVDQARELRQSGASLDTLSDVLSSPLISQLRQRQTDLNREAAQLRERLGPNHPQVIEMAAEQRELRNSINQQVGRFIQQLQNEADVAAARIVTLEEQLAGVQGTFQAQSQKRIQLRELERNAETAQEIYLASLARLGQTGPGNDGLAPDARILSEAVRPTAPSSTPKLFLFALLIPVGLFAGYGSAVALELVTGSGFRSDTVVTRTLNAPVVGHIPSLGTLSRNRAEADALFVASTIDQPRSEHAIAARDVAALLAVPEENDRGGITVFASSVSGEGAGPVCLSAGRALAGNQRRIVLIDADILDPTLPALAGIDPDGKSLGDYLANDAELDDIIRVDRMSPLHLIANNSEALTDAATAAAGIAKLATELAGQYDLVLIKSPPLLAGKRPAAIAAVADQLFLTVKWEMTPRDAVASAAMQLGDAREKLGGVILYDVDLRRYEVYSHGLLSRGIVAPRFRAGS